MKILMVWGIEQDKFNEDVQYPKLLGAIDDEEEKRCPGKINEILLKYLDTHSNVEVISGDVDDVVIEKALASRHVNVGGQWISNNGLQLTARGAGENSLCN